jgi:transcriptional regulator with XRE-family HTH domain
VPPTTARTRLLGLALREYRQKVGCDMAVAAHILETDVTKISRIETGQRGIRAGELKKLLAAYGVREEQQDMLVSLSGWRNEAPAGWWQAHTSVLVAASLEYLAVEECASQILSYSCTIIPELLQDEDYTLAIAAADQQVQSGTERQFVEAVQARQQAVRQSGRTNLSVVLGEAALREQVGDKQLMREQLRRIVELTADTSWITVQVLPFSAGVPGVLNAGSLSILRFPALPNLGLVHLAGLNGGVCLERPQDTRAYFRAFQQIQGVALSPAASVTFIEQLVEA